MTNETFLELSRFIRTQGNVSPLLIRESAEFAYWKQYDETEGERRPAGPPRNHIRIVAGAREDAVSRLGAMTFATRDGVHFLLDAQVATTLPGGYEILQVSGLRAGLWNLHREHRYAARMADGTHVLAGSPEGVRHKVVRVLQESLVQLTRPGASLRAMGEARIGRGTRSVA